MARPGDFRPPSESTVRAVQQRLETDQYRSVAVMEPGGFRLYGPTGSFEYASDLAAPLDPGLSRHRSIGHCGFLVLNEAYDTRWKAAANGRICQSSPPTS